MRKQILANMAGTPVEINEDAGEDTGLVVATREHKSYLTKTVFFTNPTYGREMAQDAAFGGTPVLVHDGTDTGAWTFSEPTGAKWEADSTDQYYADSKALKSANSNVGDVMQVINNVGPGTDIDMSGYTAITMWIYVDSDWIVGDSVILYAYVDGGLVGNSVKLEDYFPFGTHDRWHYINIPLADLGIADISIDAFLIEINARAGAKSPTFFIDEWYIQQTGAPIDFMVEPDKGTWFHLKAFQTTIVDAVSADNADSTMLELSYDQLLDMTPTTGYVYKRYTEGNTDPIFEARVTSLLDLLSFPYSKINNSISDGTNTLITIENVYPTGMDFILKAEDLDRLVFTLEDNFSELLFFRICAQGFVEQR